MKRQKQAYLYAATAVFLWATVASAFKISLRHLDVLHLLLYSATISVLVLFTVLVFQKKLPLLLNSSGRDYFRSMMLGFLNPFLYYTFLFKAYSLLPAQEAQPLNYTWAVVLVLLSIPLLKQRISLKNILGVVTSYAGACIIATRGEIRELHFTDPLGVSLALGSALIWAIFWIFNLRDGRDEVVKLFLNFLFGLMFISTAFLLSSKLTPPSGIGVLGALYIGLFEMGITFVVWLKALKLSETTAQVSNLIFLSPFISLFLIHTIVGEDILPTTIVGLLFIVAGILIGRSGGSDIQSPDFHP